MGTDVKSPIVTTWGGGAGNMPTVANMNDIGANLNVLYKGGGDSTTMASMVIASSELTFPDTDHNAYIIYNPDPNNSTIGINYIDKTDREPGNVINLFVSRNTSSGPVKINFMHDTSSPAPTDAKFIPIYCTEGTSIVIDGYPTIVTLILTYNPSQNSYIWVAKG